MSDIGKNENVAHLSQSLEKAFAQNLSLFEAMIHFTRDESLRFAHLQLDHADHAMSQFRKQRGLSGLIGAQQELGKQMMQEYAGLGLRYAEMFHSLAKHVQSHVENAANDLRHQAEDVAEDLGQMQSDMVRSHGGIQVEHPHMPAE